MSFAPSFSSSGLRRGLIASVTATAIGAVSGQAAAQSATAPEEAAPPTDTVVVRGYGTENLSSPLNPQPLLDTARTATVIGDKLLEEQGRRTLRDAMRNITGISIQAGEGNPPGGDAMKIRGFSARDDIFVDSLPDNGNYYRDPFNSESIEVTKGPASAFAGRGNVGGTINIVSRQPVIDDFKVFDIAAGTDDYYRFTADWNTVLNEDAGVAFRLNALAHTNDEAGRDHVTNERYAITPQIGFGLGGQTQAIISYYHMRQDDLPDYGLPNGRNPTLAGSGFEGAVAPVDPENFYGYTNDYRQIDVDMVTASVRHRFSDQLSFNARGRYAKVVNDSILSAPRFVGAVTTLDATTQVVGNRKPRNQTDELMVLQSDLTYLLDTGALQHTLVAGVEVMKETSENLRRLDANGPATNLFEPVLQTAPDIAYNGTRARLSNEVASVYVFDSIEIGPQWIVNAGLRFDDVSTRARGIVDPGFTVPGFATDLSGSDQELSGSASVVYKPIDSASLYAAWGSGFETSGRADIVQLAGGNNAPPVTPTNFNVDPEKSESIEIGAKWDVLENLQLAAAVFQIDKTNARTPGVNPGDPPVVLDGEQRVQGFEVSGIGTILPGWNLIASYTWLDGEVRTSNNAFEVGQRLDNLPENSVSLWTSYRFAERFEIGGGVQFVDERVSDIRQSGTANIPITAPDYTVFDAVVEWELTNEVQLRLNLYNLTDEEYTQSLASAQSIPGARRSAVLTLDLEF